MKQSDLVTRSIRVEPSLWKQLKLKAFQNDVTIEGLISDLIKQYLKGGKAK